MSDPAAEALLPYRDAHTGTRAAGPWVRRAILALLAALVAAALLDVFGQHPRTSHATARAANLEVQSPTDLRGGLIFQARFTIAAHRRLAHPTLVLQRGWLESMSVNSIVPDPVQQVTRDGRLRMTYASLPAGRSLQVWIYFQANPTNVERRSQDVELADGDHRIAAIHRSVTVWP